ncbi:MAG TPA: hypothetical protein VNQ56_01830 [Pseudolabrys sp.]|nr:hypothetical protein [Pseudolabrys sp.]
MTADPTAATTAVLALPAVDYDAIHAALTATARGRAFLAEHAGRSRVADTLSVLTAVEQLGARLHGEAMPKSAPEYLHLSLVAMAGLIAAVETDMTTLATGNETPQATQPRVARLSATLRDLRDCVQVMLDSFNRPSDTSVPLQDTAPPRQTSHPHSSPQDRVQQEQELQDQDLQMLTSDIPVEDKPARDSSIPHLTWPNGIDPLAPLRALSEPERIALFS